jgi:tetratricopeptide (TPR) repeat protein
MMRVFPHLFAGPAIAAMLALSGGSVLAMGNNDDDNANASKPSPYERAVSEIKRDNYRRAIRLLNDVVSDEPSNADALNYLGFSHRKLGEFTKGVAFYGRALRIDPDHRGANQYLGEAYLSLKNLPKAEERLAHLWNICGQRCEEYRVLNRSIIAYKQGRAPNQSSSARRW